MAADECRQASSTIMTTPRIDSVAARGVEPQKKQRNKNQSHRVDNNWLPFAAGCKRGGTPPQNLVSTIFGAYLRRRAMQTSATINGMNHNCELSMTDTSAGVFHWSLQFPQLQNIAAVAGVKTTNPKPFKCESIPPPIVEDAGLEPAASALRMPRSTC